MENELEKELDTSSDDEVDGFDTVTYQGIEYLTLGDRLFNGIEEEIGTWDNENKVATFTDDNARAKHEEDKETDEE